MLPLGAYKSAYRQTGFLLMSTLLKQLTNKFQSIKILIILHSTHGYLSICPYITGVLPIFQQELLMEDKFPDHSRCKINSIVNIILAK